MVQVRKLHFANYDELRKELLPRLRGRVFHVTTPDGYAGIKQDGFIGSNADLRYPTTYDQSNASYFRKNGYVSLVDLRDVSDEAMEDGLTRYPFPRPYVRFVRAPPSNGIGFIRSFCARWIAAFATIFALFKNLGWEEKYCLSWQSSSSQSAHAPAYQRRGA